MQHIKQIKDKQKLSIPSIRSFLFVKNNNDSFFNFFFLSMIEAQQDYNKKISE